MPRQGTNPYKRKGSPFWQIWWLDASGREQRKSTRSKLLANARRQLARMRAEAENANAGAVDRFAKSRCRRLEDFVQDYRAHLQAHDRAPRYVLSCIRHLHAAIAASEATTLADFDVQSVALHLTDVRAKRSPKTHKEHVGSLKAFGTWLLENRLWPENPFAVMKSKKLKDGDKTFRRMGLSLEQVTSLAESATVRGVQEYARTHRGRLSPYHADIEQAGNDRALLYWAASTTGLRSSELGAVTWEDLHLDGDNPRIELFGRFTKNSDDAGMPLQSFVADALKAKRTQAGAARGKPVCQRDKAFHIPADLPDHVRRDAVHAGILKDHKPAYRRLDFHSMRYSCVRILRELNVPVEVVQRVLRHSDIRLTLQLYGSIEDQMVTTSMRGVVPTPSLFSSLCRSPRSNVEQDDETRNGSDGDERSSSGGSAVG